MSASAGDVPPVKSRCRPATSGWSTVRWPRKCGWVPSIPVSTTAQTIRSPWALKDRRAASALTVTHDASTCRCTGKSGQIRWMLRSGHTTGAASAATSRSTSCIDNSPVAYWPATRRGPGPPETRRHRWSSRANAASGPRSKRRLISASTGMASSVRPEKPTSSRASAVRSGAAITPETSSGSSAGAPADTSPCSAASRAASTARRPAAVSAGAPFRRTSRASRSTCSASWTEPCQRGTSAVTA